MNNMSEKEKIVIDSLISKITLKYNSDLSYKEQENFKTLIYNKNLDFSSLVKILNDLYALEEEAFMKAMESCGVVEQKEVPEVINTDEYTIDLSDFDDVSIEPIEIEEIEEQEAKEPVVENNSIIEEPLILDEEYITELPNTEKLTPLEKDEPIEIVKPIQNSVLPNSVRGYVDITLLVIILNAVCGIGLWIMLNIFYNA